MVLVFKAEELMSLTFFLTSPPPNPVVLMLLQSRLLQHLNVSVQVELLKSKVVTSQK